MKTDKQIIGDLGEAHACRYLERLDYKVLKKKWRHGQAEIDIICKSPEGILVFVEVKTRATTSGNSPAAGVNAKKEKLLTKAAMAYMAANQYDWEIRFDIIGIQIIDEDSYDIQHFQDAFFPGYW